MFTLSQYGSAIATEAAFWLTGAEDPQYPLAQLGKLTLELEKKLRALANLALLAQLDVARFRTNLTRAAALRVCYLERIRAEGLTEDHHHATGRYAFVADAIAAGALDLAERIHALSPQEPRPGHEYEDDFAFGAFLGECTHPTPDPARLDALLARFAGFLAGGSDPRCAAMGALRAADADAFAAALEELLVAHEDRIDASRARGTHLDATEIAVQGVCIEAVALLRLGRRAGLATPGPWRYAPEAILR